MGHRWGTWRQQWAVERDLERALEGTGPILAGPWVSEVGYELLYWVPFLRWVKAAYRITDDRIVVMSRGGTASWYRDISSRYVEVLEYAAPEELAAKAAAGDLKQRQMSDFDRRLVARVPASDTRATLASSHRTSSCRLAFRQTTSRSSSMPLGLSVTRHRCGRSSDPWSKD
jgi:hypothetical protein